MKQNVNLFSYEIISEKKTTSIVHLQNIKYLKQTTTNSCIKLFA